VSHDGFVAEAFFVESSVGAEFIIVSLAVLTQLASAALALSLIKTTRRSVAWLLIAAAVTLMAFRRLESLIDLLNGRPSDSSDLIFEINGLVISLLMLGGFYSIRPIFTRLARSEEELREMNDKLAMLTQEQQLLLDHTQDVIFRHDPSGRIVYISPVVEKISGFPPEEWLGPYTRHYTDNPLNAADRMATEEMLRTGAACAPFPVEIRHKNGGTVWLEISKQPYFAGNRIAGFIGVARDSTNRRNFEQERERLITELQEALASIRTLKGLLPICASCKKVRDDKGYWNQIEAYISAHSEAEFTHAICPECVRKLYPRFHGNSSKKNGNEGDTTDQNG